jgi:hypothetical protein
MNGVNAKLVPPAGDLLIRLLTLALGLCAACSGSSNTCATTGTELRDGSTSICTTSGGGTTGGTSTGGTSTGGTTSGVCGQGQCTFSDGGCGWNVAGAGPCGNPQARGNLDCCGTLICQSNGLCEPPGVDGGGAPNNGFPSWFERSILVLTNRARADPATALASCLQSGDCPDAPCYSPSPPLVWDIDLNRSARFHSTNLALSSAPLQHPSPCLLVSDIGTAYPATCDGHPSCACIGMASVCSCSGCTCDVTSSSCVTQPFDRIQMFNPAGCAENIAVGYTDPGATMDGWLLESCPGGTCGFNACSSGENGHRYNILDPGLQILGAGVFAGSPNACVFGPWATQDFGCALNGSIPKLVAGTDFPLGQTFLANWFDTAAPTRAMVNVDGTCFGMTVDRGSGGNATYRQDSNLTGCHSYAFAFTDSTGVVWNLPGTGAYQTGCSSGDYTSTSLTPCP